MINHIRIITTEGCEGCRIAINLVRKAIVATKKHIELDVIDCRDSTYKDFIKQYNITDFPTIVYMIDDKVITKRIGTRPVEQIKRELLSF